MPSSISIVVKDGFGDFYGEGSDYTTNVVNGRVYLDLLLFGGASPNFTILDGSEQFFVDYDYVSCQ